jgi:large repetitive protein
MNNQTTVSRCIRVGTPLIFIILLAVCCMPPAAASDTPTALGVIPSKSDIANLAFANQPAGTYYFKFNQVGGGGINALHISSNSVDLPNYGQVSTTTSQSGTFYVTDTGGRGYQDEAILLVAVMGEIPDTFRIHIKSSGYSWAPTGAKDTPPTLSQVTYHAGAIDQTFTKADFVYGPQNWRPAGNNEPSDYPVYYGQDMTDSSRTFKLMFVDLKAGPLGPNAKVDRPDAIDVATLNDQGAIKVEYTVENLDKVVTFDTYAWNDNTTQGHGISWSNGLTTSDSVPSAVSGYTVLGPEFIDRTSEFPTTGTTTPVYHGPETNFTANVTSGDAPLAVQFTDTTTQSVRSWFWDFGDGLTSTAQHPEHTYATGGNFTVSLAATNAKGIVTIKTESEYIRVNATTSGGGAPGYLVAFGSYESGSWGNTSGATGNSSSPGPARFTANVSAGVLPLAVRFHDTSDSPGITGWAWDFDGDNVPDSTSQNPEFVFSRVGNYSVNLTVNTASGKVYSLTVPDCIRVTDTPASGGDGWISSDSDASPQGSAGPAVTPVRTAAPSTAAQGTGGYSPLGTKIAGALLDAIIVVGVIGAGVFLWKKK